MFTHQGYLQPSHLGLMMVKFYYPGEEFPSISITGSSCALSCPHCEGRFLNGMEAVPTPEDLYDFAVELDKSGGNGFLLSGGCNERGKVPLKKYVDVLSRIDEETSLKINVHTGLPDQEMVDKLSNSGVHAVSFDMIGSKETIEKVYGLDVSPTDYKKGYELLKRSGLKVVPHITVGLNEGELDGEFRAIELLNNPSKIILNSLISSNFGKSVEKKDILSVIDYIPNKTKIIIGCMREKGMVELEIEALKKGVNGIVLPAKDTKKWAEDHFNVDILKQCCIF